MGRIAWVNEGDDYSLEDIRKNPNKYQPYEDKQGDIDTSYGDMQNDSPKMKFEDLDQNLKPIQQQPKSNPDNMLWKGANEAARLGTGAAVEAASSFGGVPSNIVDFANYLINKTRIKEPEEFQRLMQDIPEELRGQLKVDESVDQLPNPFPGKESIKDFASKGLPEDYLKSSSKTQDFINEVSSDIGSMMFPIGGSAPKVLKTLGVAGTSNAAKLIGQSLGLSKETNEKIKMGTALAASFGFQDGIKKQAEKVYSDIKPLLKKDVLLSPSKFSNAFEDLKGAIKKGGGSSTTGSEYQKWLDTNVLKTGEKLLNKKNHIRLSDIVEFKKTIRDWYQDASKLGLKKALPHLKELNDKVQNILKNNPEVPKNISDKLIKSDLLWTSYNQAQDLSKWIANASKKVTGAGVSLAAAGKFLGGTVLPGSILSAIGGAGYAGAPLIAQVPNMMRSIFTNSAARIEYTKMMAAAVKHNTPLFIKHSKKLETALDSRLPNNRDKNNTGRLIWETE